jgi:hypothetical protein
MVVSGIELFICPGILFADSNDKLYNGIRIGYYEYFLRSGVVKKAIMVLLIFVVMAGFANAQKFSFKISGGPFIPIDQDFKNIYGNSFQWGGEMSWKLSDVITVRAGVWYLSSVGQLTFTGNETELTVWSVDGGVRFYAPLKWVRPFVGVGAGPSFLREYNEIGTVTDSGIAVVGEAGLRFPFRRFHVEMGGRYSYCSVKPLDESVNIGGYFFYAGFGFRF